MHHGQGVNRALTYQFTTTVDKVDHYCNTNSAHMIGMLIPIQRLHQIVCSCSICRPIHRRSKQKFFCPCDFGCFSDKSDD